MKKPIEPALPVQPRTEEHEREERPERSEPCRQEFFMDMPRAGARERKRRR